MSQDAPVGVGPESVDPNQTDPTPNKVFPTDQTPGLVPPPSKPPCFAHRLPRGRGSRPGRRGRVTYVHGAECTSRGSSSRLGYSIRYRQPRNPTPVRWNRLLVSPGIRSPRSFCVPGRLGVSTPDRRLLTHPVGLPTLGTPPFPHSNEPFYYYHYSRRTDPLSHTRALFSTPSLEGSG